MASTKAFLREFRRITGNPVKDSWYVQRWMAPDPADDVNAFLDSVETKNYSRRLDAVNRIMATGKLL